MLMTKTPLPSRRHVGPVSTSDSRVAASTAGVGARPDRDRRGAGCRAAPLSRLGPCPVYFPGNLSGSSRWRVPESRGVSS